MKIIVKQKIIILLFCLFVVGGGLSGQQIISEKPNSQKSDMKDLVEKLAKIKPASDAIEMKETRLLPKMADEQEDHYLWDPVRLDLDMSGNIYITDWKANSLMKYDAKGNFIKKIGKSGQGPGDLSYPRGIRIIKDKIMVVEGNFRIQLFDLDGNSQKIIPLFKAFMNMDMDESEAIYGIPISSNHLVEELSPDGKLIRSFGDKLDIKNLNFSGDGYIYVNKNKEIVIVFRFFPIMRKYSQTGDLLAEYRIKTQAFDEKEKFNLKSIDDARWQKKNPTCYQVVSSAEISGDHLFISDFDTQRYWIREINEKGTIIRTFWAHVAEGFADMDIFPREENNQMTFYVLRRGLSPWPGVSIFRPMNKLN